MSSDIFNDHMASNMANQPELSGWDDGSLVCEDDNDSDNDSNNNNSQKISILPENVLVQISKESQAPKGKLMQYWALATEDENGNQDRCDFQCIKDMSEGLRLDGKLAKQKKRLLNKEQTQIHVQNFWDRAREKKIKEGWIPGQKWVSVTVSILTNCGS